MKRVLADVDDIPVTLVVAIAYATLAVVTGMLPQADDFDAKVLKFGLLVPPLVAAGEPWRLLAHAFLHGNVIHLLVNMSTLFALGPALERSLGSVRFALLYVLSALGGGVAVCICWPYQPVLGGSGALFGMMGALVAINMRAGRHVFAFLDFEGPRRLLGLIAVNLLIGFMLPFISNTAHVGGLIAGFLATLLWLRPGAPSPAQRRWRVATAALLASLTLWTVFPVTRWDWLLQQSASTVDPARAAALQRASELSLRAAAMPIPPGEDDQPRPR